MTRPLTGSFTHDSAIRSAEVFRIHRSRIWRWPCLTKEPVTAPWPPAARAPSLSSGLIIAGDGMNRRVGVLASLVTAHPDSQP